VSPSLTDVVSWSAESSTVKLTMDTDDWLGTGTKG